MEVDGKVSFVYSEHFICLPKANCSEKNRSYCVKTLSNREHLEIVLADLLDMYLCSSNLLLTEREGRPGKYWPEMLAVPWKRSVWQNPNLERTNQNARIYLKTTLPSFFVCFHLVFFFSSPLAVYTNEEIR